MQKFVSVFFILGDLLEQRPVVWRALIKFDADPILDIKATLGTRVLRLQLSAHSMLGRTEVSRSSDFTEEELSDDVDTSIGRRTLTRYRERRETGLGVLMVIVTGPHSNMCSLFPCGFGGAMSGWHLAMANTCPSGASITLTQ